MKLDILCFAAHPDDVELSMSGTLILQSRQGRMVGVIDLTRGELGSRGTVETRKEEAARASEIMGLAIRDNLGMADGFFENSQENKLKIIQSIRQYQPEIVFCNAPSDRHPDHGRGAQLVKESCFLSGLVKIETQHNGQHQEKWRPKRVFHYIQDHYHKPDFVVDVTEVWEERVQSILAYETQFYNPKSQEPRTPISSPEFLEFLIGRASQFGRTVQARYGEGFLCEGPLKGQDPMSL